MKAIYCTAEGCMAILYSGRTHCMFHWCAGCKGPRKSPGSHECPKSK